MSYIEKEVLHLTDFRPGMLFCEATDYLLPSFDWETGNISEWYQPTFRVFRFSHYTDTRLPRGRVTQLHAEQIFPEKSDTVFMLEHNWTFRRIESFV